MSEAGEGSAVDAIVDANLALRDEVDELTEERDRAAVRLDELTAAAEQQMKASVNGGVVSLADEDSSGDLDVASLLSERDSYLADSQRLAADFANYRKQSEKRVSDAAAAQSAGLVRNLLPVLDACDSALELDSESAVGPIRNALLGELERSGLELLAPEVGVAFDPEMHDAVMHEAADEAADEAPEDEDEAGPAGPVVGEVLRAGYVWKSKVVRPAMVKVVG